jgi:RNA polymerase sigma factor (sigma-70 family)
VRKKNSIWQDFRSGNRAAYEQLIRDFYQDLYTYGVRLVNNPDFVKDCIHDVFVYLWDRRSSLGDTDNVRLYLLKSLRNRMLKVIKRETLLVALEQDVEGEFSYESPIEEQIVHSEEVQLTSKRVRTAINALSPRQREVVHLRFFEGLTNDQIAGLMDITKPAVANLIHASLTALRRIYYVVQILLGCVMII